MAKTDASVVLRPTVGGAKKPAAPRKPISAIGGQHRRVGRQGKSRQRERQNQNRRDDAGCHRQRRRAFVVGMVLHENDGRGIGERRKQRTGPCQEVTSISMAPPPNTITADPARPSRMAASSVGVGRHFEHDDPDKHDIDGRAHRQCRHDGQRQPADGIKEQAGGDDNSAAPQQVTPPVPGIGPGAARQRDIDDEPDHRAAIAHDVVWNVCGAEPSAFAVASIAHSKIMPARQSRKPAAFTPAPATC